MAPEVQTIEFCSFCGKIFSSPDEECDLQHCRDMKAKGWRGYDASPGCPTCRLVVEECRGFGPRHDGSPGCRNQMRGEQPHAGCSIASGGERTHCSCDGCF